jgi:tetrahydromethanopterin S-methyltransferase subunit D
VVAYSSARIGEKDIYSENALTNVDMDTKKVAIGALLLAVSSAALFTMAPQDSALPMIIGAVASLAMAAGALLVGISGDGRPV